MAQAVQNRLVLLKKRSKPRRSRVVDKGAELRRFNRLQVRLPLAYQVYLANTGEPLLGQGFLKDISLSGLYFHAPAHSPLELGHTLDLTIATTLPELENPKTSIIKAKGEVVRLDPPLSHHHLVGVAVFFLDGPTFHHP